MKIVKVQLSFASNLFLISIPKFMILNLSVRIAKKSGGTKDMSLIYKKVANTINTYVIYA